MPRSTLYPNPEFYADYEIVGLDNDGHVVCWNDQDQAPYNTWDRPQAYIGDCEPVEMLRMGVVIQ